VTSPVLWRKRTVFQFGSAFRLNLERVALNAVRRCLIDQRLEVLNSRRPTDLVDAKSDSGLMTTGTTNRYLSLLISLFALE
jgi:hypothetical protein